MGTREHPKTQRVVLRAAALRWAGFVGTPYYVRTDADMQSLERNA